LFKEIDELKRRKQATMGGTTYRLAFSRYQSFGEWVYRIQMKETERITASSRRR
jgi:hypothetical protein